jgi:putative ABC transport system permease protein
MLSLKMALRSISANKMRAALTMLGIIIGVMALVVLVSLVNGATSSVTDAVSSLANDLLTVSISDDKGNPIRLEDLDTWAQEKESIGSIAPSATASVTGKYGADSGSFTVYGTTSAYYEIEGLQLTMGRFLNRADLESNTRVCVLNYAAASDLIGYVDCIGEEISLNGMKYTIVGVLSEDENLMSSMRGGSYTAYVPYTSLLRLSTTVTEDVTEFVVSPGENSTVEQTEETIDKLLNERFQEDSDAYSISSMDVMEEAMGSITSILSILLGGIAGISLIVGGIGIMNIMLVTVTERTREIGIRKAIGANRGTILRQFLVEAVLLCACWAVPSAFSSPGRSCVSLPWSFPVSASASN